MEQRTIRSDKNDPPVTVQQQARAWMQVLVSVVILMAGYAVLTSPNFLCPHATDEGTKRFAAGWIGAVVGYWLS